MCKSIIKKFAREKEGGVAIMAAAMSIALIGAAGLGVDTYIAQSSDTALKHIVDLTCERIKSADTAIFPTAFSANEMAQTFADNLKIRTAAPDALISITPPIDKKIMYAPVTVTATATFTPTLTAVLGAESVRMKKSATCERPKTLTKGTNPKCNVVVVDLDITKVKTITTASLAKYVDMDQLGGGLLNYIYTIIDKDGLITRRRFFSENLTIDPNKPDPVALDSGGKNQTLYIQVLNKDGSVPALEKQCIVDPSLPPPLVPPTGPPPSNPSCPYPNGKNYDDGEIINNAEMLTGKQLNGEFKVTNWSDYVLNPSINSIVTGSSSSIKVTGKDGSSILVPLTNSFTRMINNSAVTYAETIMGINVESTFLILMLRNSDLGWDHAYNENAFKLAQQGFRLDYIFSSNGAMWQDPSTGSCFRTLSPIVIDLNNKGIIDTTGISTAQNVLRNELGKTISFDMAGTGTPQKMEWLSGAGQGFLVDNRDGNAAKDMNGKRLFGNSTQHANGYLKLAATFTPNSDGMIIGDALKGLAIWVDNGDGVVQSGELKSLSELGITQISTTVESVKDPNGDMLMRSYVIRNKERIMSEDVWFGAENTENPLKISGR